MDAGQTVQAIEVPVSPSAPRDRRHDVLRVAREGSIVLVGGVVGRALAYLFNVFLARTIGADGLGLFTLGLTVTGLPAILSLLGLGQGVVRFGVTFAEAGQKGKVKDVLLKSLRVSLANSLFIALLFVLLAGPIADRIFGKPELAPLLRLLALSLPLTVVRRLLLDTTRAFKLTWITVLVERLFMIGLAFLAAALLIAAGMGIGGVVVAHLLAMALSVLLAYRLLARLLPNPLAQPEWGLSYRRLLLFSLPLSLSYLLNFSYQRTEVFFLGFASDVANVGIYEVTLRTANIEVMFLDSLSWIFAPFISDLYDQGALPELEKLYKTTAKWAFSAAWILFVGFAILAQPFMQIFGPGFQQGRVVLILLAFGQLVSASVGPSGYMLSMTGRSVFNLVNTLALLLSSIVLDLLLIPPYGLLGAAIAGGLAIAIINLLRLTEVYFVLHMHPFKRSLWKPVVAGLSAAALTYALWRLLALTNPLVTLALLFPILLALFGLFTWQLGLDEDDRIVIQAVTSRVRGVLKPRRPSPLAGDKK